MAKAADVDGDEATIEDVEKFLFDEESKGSKMNM